MIIASFQLQLKIHFRMLLDFWCLFITFVLIYSAMANFILLLRLGPIFLLCAHSTMIVSTRAVYECVWKKLLLIKRFSLDYKIVRCWSLSVRLWDLTTRPKWFSERKKKRWRKLYRWLLVDLVFKPNCCRYHSAHCSDTIIQLQIVN